jgi:DNA end-binding protein Ku
MLDSDGTPLTRRYYCPKHQRDVHPEHILRGYELQDGQYVVVRDEELEGIEPRKTREIDLRRFVDLASISPMFFDRAYFLTPAGDSNKAYRLLAEAMQESRLAGIATFVMRDREHLIAIMAEDGICRAQTLRFADELRSPEDIGLGEVKNGKREHVLRLRQVIRDAISAELDIDLLVDEYAQKVMKLAARKRQQRKHVIHVQGDVAEGPEEDEDIVEIDLVETIRQRLRQGGDEGSKRNGFTRNGKQRGSKRDDAGPDRGQLEARSKEQMYEQAKQLDIPGRSKLSKRELIQAIERTGSKASS